MGNRTIRAAVVQCALAGTVAENVARVEALVHEAAGQGAQVVLPPELFEGPYFPQEELEERFELAHPVEGHPTIARFAELAKELGVAIPVSFFERAGQEVYHSVAMVDTDGAVRCGGRPSPLPGGPGPEQ